MDGIRFEKGISSGAYLCVVEDLSVEIKSYIRVDLAKVCHGERKSLSGLSIYSYAFTIREFIKRYEKKNKSIKVGMLGELLCHVLLFRLKSELKAVSPYFNSEEASIKKGFDIILVEKNDQSVWFAEVKSGEVGKSDALTKVRTLIDLAKYDLLNRIEDDNSTTWYSAINNVEACLESGTTERQLLTSLLAEFINSSPAPIDTGQLQSAVLAPVLFESVSNPILHADILTKHAQVQAEGKFKNCIIFAIQKSTISRLESFLISEGEEK